MSEPLNILLIEDNKEHAHIISRHLKRADSAAVRLVHEETLHQGLGHLPGDRVDAILLDLRLPDSDIQETLPSTIRASQNIPIIVLSTLEDRDLAVKMVQEGAQDYLVKGDLSGELLIRAIYSAIERKHAEVLIRKQAYQKQVLFDLGQYAISETHVSDLMSTALSRSLETLDLDLISILEVLPENKGLILKAGVGWQEGYIGKVHLPSHCSLGGYILDAGHLIDKNDIKSHQVVVAPDLLREKRFLVPNHLRDHGAVSGMGVIVHGRDRAHPYGVLAGFTKQHRIFSEDDSSFLQAIANVLAAANLRHQLEDELRKRIQELDVAHRRKDEFLAALSHELRTPLHVIGGYVDILKNAREDVEFDQALDAIERNVKIETQLVEDTLEMARVITGKMRLQVSSFSIQSVVESAVEAVFFGAQAKGIQIEKNMKVGSDRFLGDEIKIRQMIWNLLANSIKFTPRGGKIQITVREEPSLFEISVQDTGLGIRPENISQVFEKFWQEDSGFSRQFTGLGLGLAIVKHIVELHGGTVKVASTGRNQGATFTVCLPKPGNENPPEEL